VETHVDELFASLGKDFVDETFPIAEEVQALVLKLEQAWSTGDDAGELLRATRGGLHTIKGNSAMMGFAPIADVAHALEDVCDHAVEAGPEQRRAQVELLFAGSDLLATLIESVLGGSLDADRARDFLQRAAQAQEVAPSPSPAPQDSPALRGTAARSPALAEASPQGPTGARIGDRDVDELLELAGEAIVGHTELVRLHGRFARGHFDPGDVTLMDQVLTDVGRGMRQMRHQLLRVRLAPIATLFQRFVRHVRDLGHERGQSIDLVIEGGQTAVDRAIISRLHEPLVHIVRNSAAHGIESVAERTAAGKPAKATILLSATMREGRVSISVGDDGRGLDIPAIVAKAKAQGMETEHLPDRELQRLIFRAGLSTAKTVSSLAGRGVGLDVVASVVQSLGGSIDVRSVPGKGTLFILDLPVTVSLQKALIFGVDSETYAAPAGFVLDTMEGREKDLQQINRVLLLSWRGDFVRAADAGRLLGCQGLAEPWARPYAVVLQAGNKNGALLVDWLSGVQEIVVKPLDASLSRCQTIAGATVLAQGRVVPILDCVEVMRRVHGTLMPERPARDPMEESYVF
jgi:two-component system, chemotaxis family, sensor kinase CheA